MKFSSTCRQTGLPGTSHSARQCLQTPRTLTALRMCKER